MSQCQDRRRGQCTENYAADGEFTISFWFWKRACATPGTWEYLFSHQNNSAGIYNEPAPECTDGQISTDAAPCSTWAEISTVINSEEERQAWIRSDPELHGADGSILDQECMECMPNWWRQYRGNYTSQLPWLVPALDLDPVEIDGSMYQVGYPMSLCLDNAGHRDMDVHRTVESFLNFKCTDPEFGDLSSPACNWKTWRRGAQAMPEDQRMRTLFKLGNEIRSEADQSVSGYTTIQLSNDLIPNANINLFLGCSDHGESSSVSGDILRTVLVDDESNRATFDWSLDSARSGGFATDSWVHLALTVDGSRVRTFVDGAEINAEQFGYNTISPGAAWTSIPTVINDLATFRAWRDFEPSVNKNISLTNAQCWECWGYDLRGDRGQQAGGYNEEAFVFPMYLALDVADQRAHRGADIDATVRSWIAFQDSLVPGTETNFVTWRRKLAAEGREGDMRSQALFIESGRIRSEDQDYVEGYSSIEITSDVAWQMTSENEAYPNPNSLNGVLSTFTLNGPVHMGVSATLDPETYYMGHIAEVSLYTRALDAEMIDCAYRDVINGGDIAVCRSPWDIPQRSYANDLVENGIGTSGNNGARVQLFGDTVMHPDLGLVFDGDGDYATVRTGDYANDGTYTLQFWFTRTDCLAPTNRTSFSSPMSAIRPCATSALVLAERCQAIQRLM